VPDWLTPDLASQIARGTAVTVVLVIITSIGAFAVGIAAAIGRNSSVRAARSAATVFVEVFRNVPTLILLIVFTFAIPNVVSADIRRRIFFDNAFVDTVGDITSLPLPYYALAATAALVLNTGAHLAEILRSGTNAVPAARIDASRTLGASAAETYRRVVLPDSLRIAFPAVTNRLVHNLKNTALVGLVAVPDVFQEIRGAIDETFAATQLLVFAAGFYLVLSLLLEAGLHRIEVALWRGRPIDRTTDV
jgi:His/Glu/Gln/Arg/opine family amino acid ABC transporter permease subunit